MRAVRVFNAHPKRLIRHAPTRTVVCRVLAGEGITNASLNIIFVADRAMIRMNSTYLRHRRQTDVLSFPLSESHAALEGEVYVNLDQARRQSKRFLATEKEERERLVIHGVLHLAGYRDDTTRGRREMRWLEDRYLWHTKRMRELE